MKVEAILDGGLHGELNRRLKRNLFGDRLLGGRHDVEDFAHYVLSRSHLGCVGDVIVGDIIDELLEVQV